MIAFLISILAKHFSSSVELIVVIVHGTHLGILCLQMLLLRLLLLITLLASSSRLLSDRVSALFLFVILVVLFNEFVNLFLVW